MATEIFMRKTLAGSLAPFNVSDAEALQGVQRDVLLRVTITQPRNVLFHRKGFALLKVAFDLWSETLEAQEFHGRPVRPEFDRFRKDLLIMSGFFRPVFNARGEIRVEAESMSFASMNEERFVHVYSALIDTVLAKILPHVKREDLEEAVNQVLAFA